MTYNIRVRELEGVKGDPAWPIPVYKYKDAGSITTEITIQKGDYVDNQKVIEVRHENGGSTLVVNKKEI